MLSCCLAAKCESNCRSVTQRLFHIVHNVRHDFKISLGSYKTAVELSAENISGLLCESRLIETLVIIAAGISRFDICHCQHIGRVNAARKERLCCFVSCLDLRDNLFDCVVDFLSTFFKGLAFVSLECRLPVASYLHFAVLPNKIVSRHKLLYTLKECVLACNISKAHINLQKLLVKLLDEAFLLHNATDCCTAEKLAVSCYVIVECLCTEVVTQTEKLLIFLVPKRKCKHTMEMLRHIKAPLFICFFKNFRFTLLTGKLLRNFKLSTQRLPVSYMSSVIFNFNHRCYLISKTV